MPYALAIQGIDLLTAAFFVAGFAYGVYLFHVSGTFGYLVKTQPTSGMITAIKTKSIARFNYISSVLDTINRHAPSWIPITRDGICVGTSSTSYWPYILTIILAFYFTFQFQQVYLHPLHFGFFRRWGLMYPVLLTNHRCFLPRVHWDQKGISFTYLYWNRRPYFYDNEPTNTSRQWLPSVGN